MNKKGRKLFGVFLLVLMAAVGVRIFANWQDIGISRSISALVVGRAQVVESVSQDKYAYQCLSDEEKIVYDQLLDAILQHKEKIVVSTTEEACLEKAYHGIHADYGGLFWESGYEYHTYSSGDQVLGIEFLPNYIRTEEEREEIQRQIDEVVTLWTSGISVSDDDYTKSKYIFETLISQVSYNLQSEDNQNIVSVFLNRETVCQGYANAVSYLCEQLDIPCVIVTGRANGQPHAWNMVRLDGEYYFIDATWGNSHYLNTDASIERTVNYGYLNATSEEMATTHVIEMEIPIPECHATANDYYRREGLYFDQWEPERIGGVFRAAWSAGEKSVSVKLSNSSLYQQMVSYFITGHHLADYCPGLTKIGYIQDENTYVLTLQL